MKPNLFLRVGLIEDSEHDRIAFRRSLKQAGIAFEVFEYKRAEEALADLGKTIKSNLDVVVVDYDLPGINGLEFFKSLAAGSSTNLPPFVMLTGAGTQTIAVEALKAGIYDYVVKDIRHGYLELIPVVLTATVRRWRQDRERLETRQALQEAHDRLEERVAARTSELSRAIMALEIEINERRKIEQQLRNSEQRLRELSHRVLEVQENDRKTVAKELHDSIGASLAAIKFSLENRIAEMQEPVSKEAMSLELIVEHVRQTIEECRRISAFLRPPLLDELGLVAAIKVFCTQMNRYYSKIRIVSDFKILETEIEDRYKIVVYRIIQEAVNNALKHSGAATIHVRLAGRDNCLMLEVNDDGCGFDPNEVDGASMAHYGLQSMRERAAVCDGTCRIASLPGKGTTVAASFPLTENR